MIDDRWVMMGRFDIALRQKKSLSELRQKDSSRKKNYITREARDQASPSGELGVVRLKGVRALVTPHPALAPPPVSRRSDTGPDSGER